MSVPVSESESSQQQTQHPPRLEVLSNQMMFSADLSVLGMEVLLVKDTEERNSLSSTDLEVLLEESISNFLSVISCFDLECPVMEAVQAAYQLCIERLMGLGLTEREACKCTDRAKLQFLGDFDLVKRSQSQILMELSTSQNTADNLNESEPIPFDSHDVADAEESPLDEDSQESIDIVETTMRNAVEQAIAFCLQQLERSLRYQSAMLPV